MKIREFFGSWLFLFLVSWGVNKGKVNLVDVVANLIVGLIVTIGFYVLFFIFNQIVKRAKK